MEEKGEFTETLEALEAIDKATKDELDELDVLTKALEVELAGDPLVKSETVVVDEEAVVIDEPLGKSDTDQFSDELIKASQAYEALEGTVHKGTGAVLAELDKLKKSLAANLNLGIKVGQVLMTLSKSKGEPTEEMAALEKSNKEMALELGSLKKSVGDIAAQPVIPGKAVIGVGEHDQEPLQKSHSEIQELLTKSVQEGKIGAQYLSLYATYKDINRLPADVRETIGL